MIKKIPRKLKKKIKKIIKNKFGDIDYKIRGVDWGGKPDRGFWIESKELIGKF